MGKAASVDEKGTDGARHQAMGSAGSPMSAEETANAVPPEDVRAALKKILASSLFRSAPQLSQFIQYIVATTLEGKAEGIKESLIGVEAFKDAKFNASTHSKVRVQAGNLRARLAEYYVTEGEADAVIITVPKGTYVPVFSFRVSAETASQNILLPTSSVETTDGASENGEPANGINGESSCAGEVNEVQPKEPCTAQQVVLPVNGSQAVASSEAPSFSSPLCAAMANAGVFRIPDDLSGTQVPGGAEADGKQRVKQGRPPADHRWIFVTAAVAVVLLGVLPFKFTSLQEPTCEVVATEQLTHDRLEKQGPLFADRSRVYFCEDSPQGCGLSYVSVKGGDTVSVPTPLPSIRPYDLSPDGSRFLVAGPVIEGRNSSLWVVPARGGSPERVGGIFASSAAWSPGGSMIAYVTGRSLYLASADGTRSHRLATLPMPPGDVRWSPDGQRLRFFITFGNPPQSLPYEIEVNGSGLHRLLKVWGSLGNGFIGNWTPDGRHYVFSLAASLGQRSIETVWSMSGRPGSRAIFGRHNSPPVRLGEDGRSYFAPVSSRDNSTIYVIGEERSGELVRYDRRDGEFVPYLNRLDGRWVTFSPDGRWVAFSNYSDGTVWCMHPDGTGKRQLTYAPSYADGIAWSPDGKWIAIDRQAAPGKWFKISLLRAPSARQGVWGADSAEGTGPEELLPADHANEGIPSWSPDSRRIAFGEMDGPTSSQGTGKEVIHICDLSSRRVSVVPGKKGVWTARWSPNGRYIAALTYDDRQQLELYDLKTRKWRDLGAEHIDNPTWSYDSRYIYYDADRGPRADAGIFRTRISDGKVELAAPYHGIRRADRTWSGLAPDDSPIVLRDVGIQEIYALHVKWQ